MPLLSFCKTISLPKTELFATSFVWYTFETGYPVETGFPNATNSIIIMAFTTETIEKHKVTGSECRSRMMPVQDALDILHGKWKLLILMSLSDGPMRFKEIQRQVEGITAKMLSKELKDLEINQLVERTVYDSTPVAVEYTRTSYGNSLNRVIDELHAWGAQHRKRVMRKSS